MSSCSKKERRMYVPGCDEDAEEIFDFPFLEDENTIEFLSIHGRIMFILRGIPGTGKDSLCKMLCDRYESSTVCCAKDYFEKLFNTRTKDRKSMEQSHLYCHKKVEEACENKCQVIIVKNTHIKKFEMQEYLNLAAIYNYTIIMAITTRRFSTNPEVLERTNSQGLTKSYFVNRLQQWTEVIPMATGWFLCPDDTLYLFYLLQNQLETLLDDGKFCRIFDVYDKENLLSLYKARELLYCKAAFKSSEDYGMDKYYLSEAVQDSYGKAFDIIIDGFIVQRDIIVAVVEVVNVTKNLIMPYELTKKKSEALNLENYFSGMLTMDSNVSEHNKVRELSEVFSHTGKTAEFLQRDIAVDLKVDKCRFMLLTQEEFAKLDMNEIEDHCVSLLLSLANDEGEIRAESYITMNDEVKVLRLSDEAWYFQAPERIKFKSVFTGLYT